MQEHNNTPSSIEQDKGTEKHTITVSIPQNADLNNGGKTSYLSQLKEIETELSIKKSGMITFSKPILCQNGKEIIFPNTINVIQGQAGVHKSRLAQTICAAFLKKENCTNKHLGFERQSEVPAIVYIDTERNLKEQLPYALQKIQLDAGYKLSEQPESYYYTSILAINREDRFTALNEYLKDVRKRTDKHLFIVLDVTTDCISDFNKSEKSMELIDLMNVAINEHDATFLCIIHENPKSDKARGHLGTEMMNKATTHMQVGYEKDDKQKDTKLIAINYLKCRNTARHDTLYLKYCEIEKGLVLATDKDIADANHARKQKADLVVVIEHLQMYLGDCTEMLRRDLLDNLIRDFNTKERTIESRLTEIREAKTIILNNKDEPCHLVKNNKGRAMYYSLIKA